MDRFEKDAQVQTGSYNYSYSYTENRNWKFCPNCQKRLFEVLEGKNFILEIKCRSCKKLIQIKE